VCGPVDKGASECVAQLTKELQCCGPVDKGASDCMAQLTDFSLETSMLSYIRQILILADLNN